MVTYSNLHGTIRVPLQRCMDDINDTVNLCSGFWSGLSQFLGAFVIVMAIDSLSIRTFSVSTNSSLF